MGLGQAGKARQRGQVHPGGQARFQEAQRIVQLRRRQFGRPLDGGPAAAKQPDRDRAHERIAVQLRGRIRIVHRVRQQADERVDAIVEEAHPRRAGQIARRLDPATLAECADIEAQVDVTGVANVVAVPP